MVDIVIASKGFLKCSRCGTIYTANPVFDNDKNMSCYDLSYSARTFQSADECYKCSHFNESSVKIRCPVCGCKNFSCISGWRARLINHFRK